MVKTITITDQAYIHLKELKKDDESFSELFERIYSTKSIVRLADYLGVITNEEADTLEKETVKARKGFSTNLTKRSAL